MRAVRPRSFAHELVQHVQILRVQLSGHLEPILVRSLGEPVDHDRPDERRRVVFCRPGFSFQPKRSAKVQYPVLLIASYEAMPEKFEEGLPDFERFLDAIAFNGQIGYTGPEAPAPEPDPESGDAGAEDSSGGLVGGGPLDVSPASSAAPPSTPSAAPPSTPTPPASGSPVESRPDTTPVNPD